MAQIRFNRDKRGYETTALVEAGGGRRRDRGGQRLLYWFRTPPGVRVGRAALDDEARRLLEAHNPDVQFDWTRLMKESMPEPPRRERDGRDGREGRDGRDRDRRDRRDVRQPRSRPIETSAAAAPPMPTPEAAEQLQELADVADVRAAEHAEEVFAAESVQVSVASTDDVHPVDATGPAGERLGAEGVRRLRSRYLDLKARMGEKEDLDESARAELGEALERLNPDAWHTPDEVSAALEQYESTFERLRSIVGRHPRRRV